MMGYTDLGKGYTDLGNGKFRETVTQEREILVSEVELNYVTEIAQLEKQILSFKEQLVAKKKDYADFKTSITPK